MSRRIEIEITSRQGDTATWRAAGAKLPKGVLDANLIPGGVVVGNVYRADVEQYMEGMEVLALMEPKTASPIDPRNERLELIPSKKSSPDVVVNYAPKGRGARRDGSRDSREGRPGRDSRRGPRGSGETRERPRREGPRTNREGAEGRERPGKASTRSGRRPAPATPPVSTVHRNNLLANLSPQELPVAEQLLRGGMPAVRSAVGEQNKNASAQGRPTVDPVTIERIAEDLLGRTNLAAWKDRAAGAISAGREIRLRDLRAVVTSAKTITHDDESRSQLKELQTALNARVEALRTQWTERLESAISAEKVEDALRLVASPPDLSTRVSAEIATKVVSLVSGALRTDQDPQRWREIVTLAVETSIRRTIKPEGIPDDEECRSLALKSAGAIPELAKLLGIKVPPPPPLARPARRSPSRRSS